MGSAATSEDERESDGDDGTGGDDSTERGGLLFSLYRQYIGEPDSSQAVYLGFGLFFAGIALGFAGLGLFLFSGTETTGSDTYWQLREAALVFAMLALPAVALSVSVLLPVGRRTKAASLVGVVVCLAATVWLTQVYPNSWSEAGNDVPVLSTYAVGLVVLAAATGSALVAQYVDRLAPDRVERVTEVRRESTESADSESVSDEQVARDIDDAMSDSTLTWGGVEKKTNTKRLNLDMPDTDADIDEANLDAATETRASGDDVNDAVEGLQQMKGSETETARAESPDDQVDALTQFREQKQEDDEIETGVESESGTIDRLRDRLFR